VTIAEYVGGIATRRRTTDLELRLRELSVELTRAKPAGTPRAHLDIAVTAMKIVEVADRIARAEIMAAREFDGLTWADVGKAFGVSTQTAHERFCTGPDGLHSRLFKLSDRPGRVGGSTASGRMGGVSGTASRTSRAARRARADRS
jgi:hypothetical protein